MRVAKPLWIAGVMLIASTFGCGSERNALEPAVPRVEPDAPSTASPTVGMVLIRAGTFTMGSDNGADRENWEDRMRGPVEGELERPVHTVTLSAFYLDEHEVTVEDYKRCVGAGQCVAVDDAANLFSGSFCNGTRSDRQQHPINCLPWGYAVKYCEWLDKRLPTEAEWEYAARGTASRTFPWGEEVPTASRAVVEGLILDGSTEPVCSKPAGNTPEGVCDLAGNVWEWVSDWYGPYSSEAQTDPRGPQQGTERVYRGGTYSEPGSVRASLRDKINPNLLGNLMFGFRCARGISR